MEYPIITIFRWSLGSFGKGRKEKKNEEEIRQREKREGERTETWILLEPKVVRAGSRTLFPKNSPVERQDYPFESGIAGQSERFILTARGEEAFQGSLAERSIPKVFTVAVNRYGPP